MSTAIEVNHVCSYAAEAEWFKSQALQLLTELNQEREKNATLTEALSNICELAKVGDDV